MKIINRLGNFIKSKLLELDSKTINSGYNNFLLIKKLISIPALIYLLNKKKIDKIDGYLSPGQEFFLLEKAFGLNWNATIVEIGSYKGKSTVCLGLGTLYSNKKIYAIDTFKGGKDFFNFKDNKPYKSGFLSIFKKNIIKLGISKHVQYLVGRSDEIGRHWNRSIDFLFIDASHLYKDVLTDYKLYAPHVKKGGIIIFHDVVTEFPGVLRAWKKLKTSLKEPKHFLSFGYGYKK